MNLFPYQVTGAVFLAMTGKALLADDPGLGKTAQAIAACDAIDAKYVLVVCPASVRENWRREFAKFSTRWCSLRVVSYAGAITLWNTGCVGAVDCLILDEAHALKNPKAKRTQAIFGPKCDGLGGLVERAEHVFALTGTPSPNNPSELWPMLHALAPHTIMGRGKVSENEVSLGRPMSYWSFVQRYCKTRDNGFGLQIVGGRNLDELKSRIQPFFLRRKKEDVLKDLPPIRFDELPLDADFKLPAAMKGLSAEVERALTESGIDGLKSIATHVAALRQVTALAKVVPAGDWIEDQLDAGTQKLVVFAHHRAVLDALGARFAGRGTTLTGGTAADDRQRAVDLFQRDPLCRIFFGQIQAAGIGITLTAASDCLFVESSWVPAENEQAAMRIHRIGQKNACIVRFATLPGSIDEKIQRAVMRKTADISKLFG